MWYTKDGEIVSIHDATLDRVSDGTGSVYDYTLEELKKLDFGVRHGEAFKGMQIVTFEEILKKFAGHVIMNIHLKTVDYDCQYDRATLQKIIDLIYEYDCPRHVYFMSGNKQLLYLLQEMAPEIARCAGAGADKHDDLVQKALDTGATKIQLFKPYFQYNAPDFVEKAIQHAHEHGIRVNMFFADDPQEAIQYLEMGADTILTNDYQRVAHAIHVWQQEQAISAGR